MQYTLDELMQRIGKQDPNVAISKTDLDLITAHMEQCLAVPKDQIPEHTFCISQTEKTHMAGLLLEVRRGDECLPGNYVIFPGLGPYYARKTDMPYTPVSRFF